MGGLELLAEAGIDAIHRHDLALAARLRDGLGLPPGHSAIVATDVPEGTTERLQAAGIMAAGRAGRLRLSVHVHNDRADIDRTLEALGA